jgi:hypothetical protein
MIRSDIPGLPVIGENKLKVLLGSSTVTSFPWMGARVVDWARLESVCTARYRGFESLPIRHASKFFSNCNLRF